MVNFRWTRGGPTTAGRQNWGGLPRLDLGAGALLSGTDVRRRWSPRPETTR